MRRSYIKWLLLAIIMVAFLVFFIFGKISESDKTDQNLGTVVRSDLIKRITVSGNVVPKRKTLISAPYNGYIKKIYVSLGQAVKAGEPLVTIVKSLQIAEKEYPLRAPYDGIVVLIPKSEGEYVATGSDEKNFILRIDDLSQLYMTGTVPENSIVNIKVGLKASLRANSIQNKQYEGIIRDISLATQEQSNPFAQSQAIYPVKLEILNADSELRSGMSILADIIVAEKKQVLVLPHEYIYHQGQQYYVVLANGEQQNVVLGLQNNQFSEILEGLQEGQQVKQVNYLAMGDE